MSLVAEIRSYATAMTNREEMLLMSKHVFEAWADELERLERTNAALLEGVRNQIAWLKRHLEAGVHPRGYSDRSGHPHGFAVIEIPDWDARQKIESLKEDIALAERESGT